MKLPRLFGALEQTKELSKLPLVELAGPNRVLVENHLGVLAYSPNEIQIKLTFGKLSIAGNDLEFMQLNREQLVITGNVDALQLHRR